MSVRTATSGAFSAGTTSDRISLARRIIDYGLQPADLAVSAHGDPSTPAASATALLEAQPGMPVGPAALVQTQTTLAEHWPAGLAPTPQPIVPAPGPEDPLPKADYVVVTWTVAEFAALADVFTPGISRTSWYRYAPRFADHYAPLIRKGAPAHAAQRLGSYFMTKIGDKSVLVMKSELHLNQDGVSTGVGTATLPVADFFTQIIAEAQPTLLITTGTAGAVYAEHELGDVMVTRAAKFRAQMEFRNEPWANQKFVSDFDVDTSFFPTALELMALHKDKLIEPDFGPPSTFYDMPGGLLKGHRNNPDIKLDGRDFKKFHPILTTDYFEFGTSTNHLSNQGCGVEMGDAVLGLVAEGMADPPRWLVVRNASDPRINGLLPTKPDVQAMWAVWFYEQYGYWTSVSSAITCWAVIAGDQG